MPKKTRRKGRRIGLGRQVGLKLRKLRFSRRTGRWWGVFAVFVTAAVAWAVGCSHQEPQPAVSIGRPMIRVRIIEKAQQIQLAATGTPTARTADGSPQQLRFPSGAAVPVTLTPAGWQVGAVSLEPGELVIEPESDGSVSIDGVPYHGTYHLVPVTATTFDVVNHLDVEAYLKGVLARELYPEFEPEAYRAQAIVSRTYALYTARTAPPGRAWDLHADTKSQMYGGIKAESAKSRAASDDTTGVVLAYGPPGQQKIFKAYFSSCCGGATQSAADAFHEPAFEPLSERYVGPRCDTSAGRYHSKFNWGPVVVSKAELTRRFRAFGQNRGRAEKGIGTVQRIDVMRANAGGRPVQFLVTDDRNVSYALSGEDLRNAVNTSATPDTSLPSSYVTPVTDSTAIRFTNGHGHGHGVGMCQWCAEAEAKQGVGHETIVLGAFRGATLIRAY